MKSYYKTISSVFLALSLVISTVVTPVTTALATTGFDSEFGFDTDLNFGDTPEYFDDGTADTNESGETVSESESSFTECALEASRNLVTIGESITLQWETQGFTDITINGDAVSETSGTKIISNLQESTTFTMEALSDNGAKCVQQVVVECVPPPEPARCEDYGLDFTVAKFEWTGQTYDKVEQHSDYVVDVTGNAGVASWDADPAVDGVLAKAATAVEQFPGGTSGTVHESDIGDGQHEISTLTFCANEVPQQCELDIDKTVDATTAVPGDELTYTITVENTGTADCTGGGVLIEDVVDDNVSYLRHELSSNVTAGYGSKSVYTSGDRTLRFNAGTLEPGESGTITWTGAVHTPSFCGDFVVKNQARVTAAELDNYTDWVTSQLVKTDIDYDCAPPVPECELSPAVQSIGYGETAELSWVTGDASSVTLTSFGAVAATGTATTDPLFTDTTYTLTATGEGGEAVCEALVEVGDPADEFITLVAEKIVCTDEADLPNYGTGGPAITEHTAAAWVEAHESCSFAADWEFQWTNDQVSDPGDTLISSAGTPWHTFGPTNTNGLTAIDINISELTHDTLWFREVLQEGYIPFTHGLNGGTNVDDVSAEFYCDTDVLNYDNREFITDPQADQTYHCVAWNAPVPEEPAPSCDAFTANPSGIIVGASSTLSWGTSNADQVFINNGIGEVALDGTIDVSPLADTTYTLTAVRGEDEDTCNTTLTVSADPVPICETFTASPDALPVGGGTVTLDWNVLQATNATITPAIGAVALSGAQTVDVTESTTYTLTAVDDNGDEVSCVAPVAVSDPEPQLTCADNVSFSASDTSIERGDEIDLVWSTTDVDAVSISNVGATGLAGSVEVSPSDDITYTLTATRGNESVDCPVSIDVSSGGGGGGGASPRCELTISDRTIRAGEEIELEWESTRAKELTLRDDRDTILFTTDDYLADDKEQFFDGSITLAPKRDTEYTLTVERGRRDRDCSVEVEVEDDPVTVLETRDREPLVAGIALSQTPYTGFPAGPFLTFTFYALLAAWALYITYMIVLRQRATSTNADTDTATTDFGLGNRQAMQQAEALRPDVFAATTAPTAAPKQTAPANLPTGTEADTASVVPEAAAVPPAVEPAHDDAAATKLEDQAHTQHALLSSDAIRYFMGTVLNASDRTQMLDEVIAEAKQNYPLEDGWVVINESRMRNLCTACQGHDAASSVAPYMPTTVPEGAGSLAEAIVTGNVVAAYAMIGNRPMIALADAAADLDALYRTRQGADATVSTLLQEETQSLSDEQIQRMIAALTGALDGTYTDEASAVKMAIMKAVKELG